MICRTLPKKKSGFNSCQDLENSIHSDEWNADDADCADTHGFGDSTYDISLLSFENIALLKSGFLPKLNKSPTCLLVAFR